MGIDAGGYYYTQIFHDNIAVNHINFHNSSSAGAQYTDHTIVNAGDTIKVTFYNKIQSDFNIIFVPFK